jgi:hypothetical protein
MPIPETRRFSEFSVKKIYLVVLGLFCAAFTGAAELSGLDIEIRYFDKRLYYPQTGDIFIQIVLTNNSAETRRFRLSDDRAFSLDFDVRTLANRSVENAGTLIRKRTGQHRVFFREISLEPGESFSFTENLRNWRQLDKPGSYIVQGKFYPDLFKAETGMPGDAAPGMDGSGMDGSYVFEALSGLPSGNGGQQTLTSNRLNLQIRAPSVLNAEGIPVALDEETEAVYFREPLPPDEVVAWTLRARQKSQWEKFFLYLNLELMIQNDPTRERKWRAESEEGQRRMLAKYREDIGSQTIDGDITALPFEFDIERTSYNANEGTVTVLEKFRVGGYTERKRYTYYLTRTEGIWTIVDYIVQNLGTE